MCVNMRRGNSAPECINLYNPPAAGEPCMRSPVCAALQQLQQGPHSIEGHRQGARIFPGGRAPERPPPLHKRKTEARVTKCLGKCRPAN